MAKKTKKWWEDRIKDVEELITYLKNNREGIYGVKQVVGKIPAEHIPFGSGPMERLCGVIAAHRMKGHGKVWKKEWASNMVWLLSREFQKLPQSKLLKNACSEAKWWQELQAKPLMSSFDLQERKTTARAQGQQNGGSMPILKTAGRSAPNYSDLKKISGFQNIV